MGANMKQYFFSEEVFMAEGYKFSCLYDLKSNKLYHINKALTLFLKQLLFGEINCFSDEETKIISELLDLNILCDKASDKNTTIETNSKKITFSWIEVTDKCNLKCIHCYENSGINSHKEMSVENFLRVISQLKSIGVRKVQIIGGEPFVLKDKLKLMLGAAFPVFDQIEIYTNGTLIDKAWIDYFKNTNIKIALSVYSYLPGQHDKVTGTIGSHALTNGTIRMLYENNIPYRVSNVLMDGVNLGDKNTDLYKLSPNKDIVRLSGRADFKLLNRDLIKQKLIIESDFKSKLNPSLVKVLKSGHNCFSNKIYISSDLNVYPCVMERRLCHGNILRNDLMDVLNEKIMCISKDNISVCKDCEYRYACFDCRPNSIYNDIYAKPWYCTYDPYLGIWADPDNFIEELYEKERR